MSMPFNEIVPAGKGSLQSEIYMFGTRNHSYTFSEPISLSDEPIRLKPFTADIIAAIEENLKGEERFTIRVDANYKGTLHQSLFMTFKTTSYTRRREERPEPLRKEATTYTHITDDAGESHPLLGFPFVTILPYNVDDKDVTPENAPDVSFLFEGINEYKLEASIGETDNYYVYSSPYIPYQGYSKQFILSTKALSSLEVLVNPYKLNGTSSEA